MKKTNSHDDLSSSILANLKTQALDSQQLTLREWAIANTGGKFSDALAKDTLKTRSELVEQVFTRLQDDSSFTWQDHAQLCVALGDIRSRDGLLRRLHDQVELRDQVRQHLAREITRAQELCLAPLATVFAGISWLDGFNDQTRVAIDRALASDASYSLALLLDIALRHDVPASVWSASLEAVSFESCLKGAA